ncbi:hypothetical protein Tco_1390416 [Tanacetum coccineum]
MQDEIHEFDRLQVWELVPQPDCVMIIALKWIYKVKLDEYGDVLKNKPRPEWLKPILEDDRPATPKPAWTRDMRTFMNWYCKKMGKTELTQADLEDQIDWTNLEGDQVRIDINQPLPLSGPPGHVTIQIQFFFNHDLDYLRYGSKGSGQALSISKMEAARYHDFGLELLVPEHMWIDDVSESSRNVVRTHMRILSVVRIKAYSRFGYDYLKEITLRRADHQEYMIAEKDFKNLYPNDFEDLHLLLLQGHLNHLPCSDILVFPVSYNERKIMRFNEIYKFSDGTLTNIMEALDYRVKEYKVNRLNSGMNTRFWTDKGSGQALSISKMKAARYHDFRLQLLKFYIDRNMAESSRKVVRTHMRILNVVRIKAYSRYGYDYLKEITLRRVDHQEYTIAEKDFKNLYPSDFKNLNLLLLQGHLNHLPGSNIRMLSIAIKLWTQNLVIRQRVKDF